MSQSVEEKSLPDNIPELEAEIVRIEAEEELCRKNLARYLELENYASKVFYPQEIHQLRQDKLRLHVEKEFCRKKINRIKLFGSNEIPDSFI